MSSCSRCEGVCGGGAVAKDIARGVGEQHFSSWGRDGWSVAATEAAAVAHAKAPEATVLPRHSKAASRGAPGEGPNGSLYFATPFVSEGPFWWMAIWEIPYIIYALGTRGAEGQWVKLSVSFLMEDSLTDCPCQTEMRETPVASHSWVSAVWVIRGQIEYIFPSAYRSPEPPLYSAAAAAVEHVTWICVCMYI